MLENSILFTTFFECCFEMAAELNGLPVSHPASHRALTFWGSIFCFNSAADVWQKIGRAKIWIPRLALRNVRKWMAWHFFRMARAPKTVTMPPQDGPGLDVPGIIFWADRVAAGSTSRPKTKKLQTWHDVTDLFWYSQWMTCPAGGGQVRAGRRRSRLLHSVQFENGLMAYHGHFSKINSVA